MNLPMRRGRTRMRRAAVVLSICRFGRGTISAERKQGARKVGRPSDSVGSKSSFESLFCSASPLSGRIGSLDSEQPRAHPKHPAAQPRISKIRNPAFRRGSVLRDGAEFKFESLYKGKRLISEDINIHALAQGALAPRPLRPRPLPTLVAGRPAAPSPHQPTPQSAGAGRRGPFRA